MTADGRWLTASVAFSALLHAAFLVYRPPGLPSAAGAEPVALRFRVRADVAAPPAGPPAVAAPLEPSVQRRPAVVPHRPLRAAQPAAKPPLQPGANLRAPGAPKPKDATATLRERTEAEPAGGASSLAAESAPAPVSAPSKESVAAGTGAGAARATYEQLLAAWLERHTYYPQLARRRGVEGTALLRIALRRDGAVAVSKLERTSRHEVLDQAALEIVRRSVPFPPVPDGVFSGDAFEFTVPIRFKLE